MDPFILVTQSPTAIRLTLKTMQMLPTLLAPLPITTCRTTRRQTSKIRRKIIQVRLPSLINRSLPNHCLTHFQLLFHFSDFSKGLALFGQTCLIMRTPNLNVLGALPTSTRAGCVIQRTPRSTLLKFNRPQVFHFSNHPWRFWSQAIRFSFCDWIFLFRLHSSLQVRGDCASVCPLSGGEARHQRSEWSWLSFVYATHASTRSYSATSPSKPQRHFQRMLNVRSHPCAASSLSSVASTSDEVRSRLREWKSTGGGMCLDTGLSMFHV